MKNFLDLAKGRRSIRKYKNDAIDERVLERILEAGRLAPSGNNSQPWRFIVVDDAAVKERLYAAAGRQPWIKEAPIAIAVVADITAKLKSEYRDEPVSADDEKHREALAKTVRDSTIAADHLVMAATDEGLGTCWIALFEQDDIRPALRVPDHCYVVAIITMGKSSEQPPARPRHSLSEIVFLNEYGRRRYKC